MSLSHAARRSLFFPPQAASGPTLDLAPVYVGEGLSAPETEPYAAGLTVDGKDLGLKPLE